MIRNKLESDYFDWMYNLVCSDTRTLSYRSLLWALYDTPFNYIIDRDGNRFDDGINFRYRFGYDNNYPEETINKYLDVKPCNVVEMMIALAHRIEEQIMTNSVYGDRTGQWFWNMISCLGLTHMSDTSFDIEYVENVILRFLNRDYSPNGAGGLFIVQNPPRDMRDVEIWCQAMWYLNDILED